ncbi:drug/metabolite transporter (DMT)-like permease [Bradyrhizobium sp. JR3.5]
MDETQRDRTIGSLCLVVTAFGWALNWPLMKLLLQQWPPLFARGLAGICAAVILGALALARGQSLAVPREALPRLLFASFTNVFAWMGFGTIAMKFVTVGEGALLAYTMPIWAMLFAWPVLHSRPTLRDLAALVLGVAGVALLLGGNGFGFSADKLTGIALALACAILFALGNVLNRKPLPMPPLAVVAWQVGIGCGDAAARRSVRAPELCRDHAVRPRLLCLYDADADGHLLSHLVRDAAPPAADIGVDRHAAGAGHWRDFGCDHSRRAVGAA